MFSWERVIWPWSRYEEVVGSFRYLVTSLHIGDALEECTQIAAMVSAEHLERVQQYFVKGIDSGARLIVGGGLPAGLNNGWFLEPTMFC